MIRRTFDMDTSEARKFNLQSSMSIEDLTSLTYFDIAAWRAKRFTTKLPPQWIGGKWVRDVIEEINATVTIKTNIADRIEVPVKAFVVEPKILPIKDIDFGKVQIGT